MLRCIKRMKAPSTRVQVVAAGAVAALLVGYLWLAPATDGTVAVAPPPQAAALAAPDAGAPEAPSTPPSTSQRTLEDMVPGFEGTLFAHLGMWGRMDGVHWPSRRIEPVIVPLPRGITLSTDATGRLLVGLAPSAIDGPGQALYVGPASTLRPAAVNATSAAFHATAPGRLAWLEITATGARLRLGAVDPGGTLAASSSAVAQLAANHRLVDWGDWGFLLAGWDPAADAWVVYLLDMAGTEQWRVAAVAASVSARGDVLLANDEPGGEFSWSFAPAGTDGALASRLDWVPPGADVAAAWSPDAAQIAFLTPGSSGPRSRIDVRRPDGTPVATVEVALHMGGAGWSHDGRFVLARAAQPNSRNVVYFFDTRDGSIDEVEFDSWVQLAATRAGQR